ncbi:MAG: hypothetical protein NT178_14005 [Proteobacteria bacterium]|nr:hypothetical protein [Pseudomonadota bacterium]
MDKEKRWEPTEETAREYTQAREKLLNDITDHSPPTPKEYEQFYSIYRRITDWAVPRCRRCFKLLKENTPDVPDIESIIDLDRCEKSRSKKNCYVLLEMGFKARCGEIEYGQDNFYQVTDNKRESIDSLPRIPAGLCRDQANSKMKAGILHFFLVEKLYPRNDNLYCDACKNVARVEKYNKEHPEKRKEARNKYINTLDELPKDSPHNKK